MGTGTAKIAEGVIRALRDAAPVLTTFGGRICVIRGRSWHVQKGRPLFAAQELGG